MWFFPKKRQAEARLKPRVEQLELELDELKHDLNRVTTQHHKLAGAYYRRFGTGDPPTQRPDAAPLSKADLLRKVGYIPGRPAPHSGE